MRLLALQAINVFSIGNVELDLIKRGVVLVSGYSEDEGSANGAGKSSVANKAILWGLYGRTASGSRADSVINCHNPKSTSSVTIEFASDDSSKYKLVRSRNPNKLRLYALDGTDLSSRNEAETQDKINKILGKDFDTFVQTDFFGQGRSASYVTLKPADQKAVLESILPIEKLNEWAEKAKLAVTSYTAQLKTTSNQVDQIKSALRVHTANENMMLQKMNAFELNREKQIKTYEARLQQAQEIKKTTEEEIQRLKALIIEGIPESFDKDSVILSLEGLKNNSTTLYIEAVNRANTWKNEIDKLKNKVVATVCDKCGQELSRGAMNMAVERNKQIEQDIIKASENFARSSEVREYQKAEQDRYKEEIEAIKKERLTWEKDILNNRSIEREINTLVLSSNAWESESRIEQSIKECRNTDNPYFGTYESYTKAKKEHEEELSRLEAQLLVQGEIASNYNFWHKTYSVTLKTYLLESVCPFLEARTKVHLDMLGNSQIHAKFSTCKVLKSGDIKEDFNVTVWSDTGGEQYDLLSGGEQVMTDFAIGLALSDLAESQTKGRSNILILDEPFTNLDARNCENVTNYLNSMDKETIIVISNEDGLKGLIPNRIHVIKKNGISNLEV